MVGFVCETVEEKNGFQAQASGNSGQSSDVHTRHRRSKSASDKNVGIPRGRALGPRKKDKNETQVSSPSTSSSTGRCPWHDNPIYLNKNMSSHHRVSLEKDIEQLQLRLQEEKSMRNMLERAMGRVSSTLSPGHRHFSNQTKELISELESLEEEVANREQHVLSLYRSIFESCASKTPSAQSSLVASPAHTKNGSRKHPSIISSAFCSTKNFSFRHLRALAATYESGKRTSKGSHIAQSSSKSAIDFAKTHSNLSKVEKIRQRIPVLDKTSVQQTLKVHLHQCPSKLAEEMVRCMSLVYCWLCSAASENIEKNPTPFQSRPPTNVLQPPDGPEKSMVEVSCISTDKKKSSHASYAINNYRKLVEQLEKVDVTQLELNAQLAFWINVYNALLMHAYLAYGIPNSSLRRLALFHKAAYNIGGLVISANAIEQSIFGIQTSRNGWLKLYTASNVRNELEEAKRDFIRANIAVKKSRKVLVPKMLEKFSREASFGSGDLLKCVTDNADKMLHDSIRKCIGSHKSSKKASQIIEWLPYSTSFRYIFSKDLAEKPWWL